MKHVKLNSNNSHQMKKQVCIIDDDPIYRMIASKTINIAASALTIHQCKNGEEGLAKLEDLKNSNHETVVFLDINMPGLNGWDVLDGINQNDFYTLSKLQVYMVSSSTDERDLLKSKQYSFVMGFLYKPLSKEDLISAIGSE
jgi:CheY-like chemotaxis protein